MEYTVENAHRLGAALRALPAKDPAKLKLDKQGMVKLVVDEIAALQQRGYTLEEIAQGMVTEGLEITTPTLKSYLQRIRKASGKGAAKAPRRSPSMPVREQGGPKKTSSEKAPPPPPTPAKAEGVDGAPKSTQSEFIATDRPRL